MPIRTNRGRAAVYRRIWGAPLRSPRHLIVTVVVLVALITTIGVLIPRLLPGEPQATSNASAPPVITPQVPVTTTPSEEPTETRLTEFPLTPKSAPADPAALTAARKWALAWVNHPEGTTSKEWVARLKPYTDQEYLAELKTVDVRRIPAEKVVGKATAVNSTAKAVDVKVRTDGPTLRITVVKGPDGWRVTGYSEAGD